MRGGTSPQQVPTGPQPVQLMARSPPSTPQSSDKNFLGGRPPTSPPQAINANNKQQATFIAQSRVSMKGSPLVAHYLPTEQYAASPPTTTGRDRTTTVSSLHELPSFWKRELTSKIHHIF